MARKVKFTGSLQIPGDKSISHRALMFSLLAQGRCLVSRLSPAEDCQSTRRCLEAVGVPIQPGAEEGSFIISATPANRLQTPGKILDAGNSGTTIRLLSGLLAGAPIECTLDGDESLRKRPMARVLDPLSTMGAQFSYQAETGFPPFTIKGSPLTGKEFHLKVASAQVQTALLLAGLHADGETIVELPAPVRDHTERMLKFIGVAFERPQPLVTAVSRLTTPVSGYEITVAGDISSAAFFMVAAACAPGSRVELLDVGMNSGRTLVIDVLREMGADITVANERELCGEPVANIIVTGDRPLKGTTIAGDRIAAGIDEIPILALAGAFAQGSFIVRDAKELRVKESDRLSAIVKNFSAAGAKISESEDGFAIEGSGILKGGSDWHTFGDHRLAMTAMVANLLCDQPLSIDDVSCAAVSYPEFERDINSLIS